MEGVGRQRLEHAVENDARSHSRQLLGLYFGHDSTDSFHGIVPEEEGVRSTALQFIFLLRRLEEKQNPELAFPLLVGGGMGGIAMHYFWHWHQSQPALYQIPADH